MKNRQRILIILFFATALTSAVAQRQRLQPFITTWEVGDDGDPDTLNDLEITIYTHSQSAYSYTVDWGDGNTETDINRNATHTYTTAGTYTVSITGTFPRIYFFDDFTNNSDKIKTIQKWGNNAWTSMEGAFFGCVNLTIEDDAGNPDLSGATNLSRMFNACSKMNSPTLNNWNVSNITDMTYMFNRAAFFNQDLNNWDVGNVVDMLNMFAGASSFNGDITNWNVSSVRDMDTMFSGANAFNQDIGNWNVSSVTSMIFTFNGATSFNQDIGNWDVSNVNNTALMFAFASAFDQDIGGWDVSQVVQMNAMFWGAISFNQDLSNWNVEKVTNMRFMFESANNFDQDISNWNVFNVIDLTEMFGAIKLSTANYDALLRAWSALPPAFDAPFSGGLSQYCDQSARDILTRTYNWSIVDGGKDTDANCAALSVVDNQLESQLFIYPNPANEKITIESPFTIDKLELYNVLGAKIFSVSKTNVLDLTSLSQGVYILKVFSEDRVVSRKVVVE